MEKLKKDQGRECKFRYLSSVYTLFYVTNISRAQQMQISAPTILHYACSMFLVEATRLQVSELQVQLSTITTDFGETVSNLKKTKEV